MKSLFRKLSLSVLIAAYIGAPLSVARADDTEIYFGVGSVASTRPNVLFIIDDSGSMKTEVPDSGGKSRMTVVREGLQDLLTTMSGKINVGLMNFSAATDDTNGGPILYPVTGIDEVVSQSYNNFVSEDAHQVKSLPIVTNTSTLVVGKSTVTVSSCSGTDCLMTFDDNALTYAEDNVEVSNSGSANINFNSGGLGANGSKKGQSTLGFRFRELKIPQGAKILSARMRFTQRDLALAGTSCNAGDYKTAMNLKISVEATDDAASFSGGLSGRTTTGSVSWNTAAATYKQDIDIYTSDLSGLVQSIVDRSGWEEGQAIAFYITQASGNDGCREIYSASSASSRAQAPSFEVQWDAGTTASTEVKTGFLFSNLPIPQGSSILSATLEYMPSSDASSTVNLSLAAEDVDNPASYSTSSDLYSRTALTSPVDWSDSSWVSGNTEISKDIKAAIQTVVNRSGWCGGNSISLILTADAKRTLYALESGTGQAKLNISYKPESSALNGCTTSTVSYSIGAGANDAEENSSTGIVYNNASYLHYVTDGASQNNTVALRFPKVALPNSVTEIVKAELSVMAANSAGTATTVQIKGASDAALASMPTAKNGLSTLAATSATPVSWSISGWTSGKIYTSPNFKDVVKSMVDDASWTGDDTGNNMVFLLSGSSGSFAAHSYETSSSSGKYPPKLTITFKARYSPGVNDTVRQAIKNMVNELQPNSWTPYSGVLLESANYFKGGEVYFGKQRGKAGGPSEKYHVSHPDSIVSGSYTSLSPAGCTSSTATGCKTEAYAGSPVYKSPIIDKCQSNHIVFLTDGVPNSNSSTTAGKIKTLTGSSCEDADNGIECSKTVAKWLQTDVSSTISGTQKVNLHTIGFTLNISLLDDLAKLGGGIYASADNSEELKQAFESIIGNITASTSTFVSAGVTVDQFNRLKHSDQLYFALFEAGSNAKWHGNVKKYKLVGSDIRDQLNINAIDSSTGKFTESSHSYWSVEADGNDAKMGGAASLLPTPSTRKVYTNLGDVTNVDLSDGNNNFAVATSRTKLTNALVGASSDAERDKIINWGRGMDVNSLVDATAPRYQMGDPIHTQPQVVIYKDGSTSTKSIIFSSNNEGFLHAINADTGVEEWAWIPEELLNQLPLFMNDATMTARESGANGLDGHIAPYVVDKNLNGVIETGDQVLLMVGMRRGGKNYYMLDVTNLSAPKLLYRIEGGSTTFPALDQTWSKPAYGRIKFGSTVEKVAILTGGYNTGEDSATTPSAGNSTGNAIYIVRVSDGALLWKNSQAAQATGVGLLSTMTHAIPAGATAVDWSGSGYLESFYVADLRGQVFRFDIKNGESDITKVIVGGRIAHLGGSAVGTDGNGAADEANNRRFFSSPSVAVINRPSGKTYAAVAVGSGYRAHPLNTVNKDQFFMIRDQGVLAGKFDMDVTYNNLLDITDYPDPNHEITTGQNLIQYIEANNYRGWRLDLSDVSGQKVLSQAVIFNNRLIFSTYIPKSDNSCSGQLGSGRTYVIDINDGSVELTTSDIDEQDRYVVNKHEGIPPDPKVLIGDDAKIISGTEVVTSLPLGMNCGDRVCAIKWRKTQ